VPNCTQFPLVAVPVESWSFDPAPCTPVTPLMEIAGVAPPELTTGYMPVTVETPVFVGIQLAPVGVLQARPVLVTYSRLCEESGFPGAEE